jgi:hypothetical protein
MFKARNKTDLIIEVWEKLDCESVGRREIESIETAVRERFGRSAVESPMIVARLLADEGAELRHSEIMELYVKRESEPGQDAIFRNILQLDSLKTALNTVRNLENARRKFTNDDDKEGLRQLRQTVIEGKNDAQAAAKKRLSAQEKLVQAEIAEWLTIWLQAPELFESWVGLRQRSTDFLERFGESKDK